jgi:hypothetical protein
MEADRSTGDRGNIVIDRLKMYDWTFSGTAEPVVASLLMIALVVSTFA